MRSPANSRGNFLLLVEPLLKFSDTYRGITEASVLSAS